jgi:hypothetical protein
VRVNESVGALQDAARAQAEAVARDTSATGRYRLLYKTKARRLCCAPTTTLPPSPASPRCEAAAR